MRVIHLLRKFDPAEWGGTETAVQRLFEGLGQHGIESAMYCPRLNGLRAPTAFPASAERTLREETVVNSSLAPQAGPGCAIRRFKACVPVWGISSQQKRQLIAVGGNLMSFDLLPALWREPGIALIHTHTLGRLGGIAATVARGRRLPLVVTIHGGCLDLPPKVKNGFRDATRGGFDWGRFFGLLLQSHRVLTRADAILTCNPNEAALLRIKYPRKRIQVQPHGIPLSLYQADQRAAAAEAFPQLRDRQVLLCVGRIDPVKNQGWLVTQAPEIFRKHPDALLVFAGACTDEAYGISLRRQTRLLGVETRVLFVGGLTPADPRLIGLFQQAQVVVLPSLSETFGLVLLEAWAAGTPVISSRTSGASALVRHGENGWLFDLENPQAFHEALRLTLRHAPSRRQLAAAGNRLVQAGYSIAAVAARVKQLYEELLEAKHALRDSPG